MSEFKLIKNFMKRSLLLHDGFESDFVHKQNIIHCPICGSQVIFTLFNSKRFDLESELFKKEIAKRLKGVKENPKKHGYYNYKGEAINFFKSGCSLHKHTVFVFFTFSEVQPARYISNLIGIFG